jgi:exonuclease VII small subunit
MWKKQDDSAGTEPEFTSKAMPEAGEALMESSIVSRFEKWNVAAGGARKLVAEDAKQPSRAPNMATYTEALNEFTRSATAFIEQLPLLTKARDAYEQAMKISAEMRQTLDTGEENLKSLMTQLEQAVKVHGVESGADRKKPEPAKVETLRGTEEGSTPIKRYP